MRSGCSSAPPALVVSSVPQLTFRRQGCLNCLFLGASKSARHTARECTTTPSYLTCLVDGRTFTTVQPSGPQWNRRETKCCQHCWLPFTSTFHEDKSCRYPDVVPDVCFASFVHYKPSLARDENLPFVTEDTPLEEYWKALGRVTTAGGTPAAHVVLLLAQTLVSGQSHPSQTRVPLA